MDDIAQLLAWIDADRNAIVGFLSGFLRAKSPNPPGDTWLACDHVTTFLAAAKLPHRIVKARDALPNIIGGFAGGAPGRHLVLNGHMDVFPAIEDIPGERSQWSGEVSDGRIYGRGAADMKCGTTASIFAYRYLHRLRDRLRGKLTLTVVSDKETGGQWGSGYLMREFADEVSGDCCLNGEPSGLATIRFGEKGTLRAVVTFRTAGGHGAYPHLGRNANILAARFVGELDAIEKLKARWPAPVEKLLARPKVRRALETSLGRGALPVLRRPTVNVGVLRGGLKINMIADECVVELEVRIPPGLGNGCVLAALKKILKRYPDATLAIRDEHSYASTMSPPDGEMVGILQRIVKNLIGDEPQPIISLGGSDARYWRQRGVPAYLYGPSPKTMARRDEHVTVEELLRLVRVHTLAGYEYLTAKP